MVMTHRPPPVAENTRVRWFLTRHALERCQEMGLSREDVTLVLENPDIDYPNREQRIASKGNVAVVYDGDKVVTILYADRDDLDARWDRSSHEPATIRLP